jgi:hypothetical protein
VEKWTWPANLPEVKLKLPGTVVESEAFEEPRPFYLYHRVFLEEVLQEIKNKQ